MKKKEVKTKKKTIKKEVAKKEEPVQVKNKVLPSHIIFPRYDISKRGFRTKAEADNYAAKQKDIICISEQPGQIYEVVYWKYFNTEDDMLKDKEIYETTSPEKRFVGFSVTEDDLKKADEDLKKKINKETKSKKKK